MNEDITSYLYIFLLVVQVLYSSFLLAEHELDFHISLGLILQYIHSSLHTLYCLYSPWVRSLHSSTDLDTSTCDVMLGLKPATVAGLSMWCVLSLLVPVIAEVTIRKCKLSIEWEIQELKMHTYVVHVWPDLRRPVIMVHTKIFSIKHYKNLVQQVDTIISKNQALQICDPICQNPT